MNQGSGTFYIPKSQSNYPIPAFLATDFANDNITIKYTDNRSLVNPDHTRLRRASGLPINSRHGRFFAEVSASSTAARRTSGWA